MALESFYGGKQGISPVIKAKFKYINEDDLAYQERFNHTTELTKEEAIWLNDSISNASYSAGTSITWTTETLAPFTMDECLKDINYTDVWYGELCIIDTDNKMNPNNGKIYRRTLKQTDNKFANTDDTLYAEYIGQIVGPSGGIPNFDFGSLDNERKKAVGQLPTYDSEESPLDNSNWDYTYKNTEGKITSVTPNTYTDIAISEAGTPTLLNSNTANIQMVPGKNGSNYNDTIKYTWCNVQRKVDGKNNDAWIYLGFEIPYIVYDVTGTEENYTYNGNIFIDTSDTQDGNKEHPFSKRYEFHIPRGTRGIGPEKIYTINPKETNPKSTPNPLYDFDAIQYDQKNDTYSVDANKIKNVNTTDSYWVAMWSLYNPKTEEVDTIYQYLGSYKDVRDVELNNNGTLTFTYSDNDTKSFNKKIKWIQSINIDTGIDSNNYGQMIIEYNNEDADFTKILPFIKSLKYTDSTGKLQTTYANELVLDLENENGEPFIFSYPKTISLETNTNSDDYGQFIIKSNTNESLLDKILPLIKNMTYDETTGEFTFEYSGIGTKTATISYISKMKVLNDGTLQYQFNNSASNDWTTITDGSESNPKPLRIKDIENLIIKTPTNSVTLENNASAIVGHLYVLYRGEDYYEDLGLVSGKAVVGPVYTLSETFSAAGAGEGGALAALQSAVFDPTAENSVGKDGRITSNRQDVTGGFVATKIQEDSNSEAYTALYYYNYNSNPPQWTLAGLVGQVSSDNSNIYIKIEQTDSVDTIYPEDSAVNPEIYFVEDSKKESTNLYNINNFSPWVGTES